MSTRGRVFIILALFLGTLSLLLLLWMRKSPQFAPCKLSDDVICELVANVKSSGEYSGTYTITKNRKALTYTWSVYQGNVQITGLDDDLEILNFRTVGDTLYLKDPAGEAWWEELKTDIDGYVTYLPFQPDSWIPAFTQLVDSGQAEFTRIGEEACLDSQCVKYRMVLPDDEPTQQHMLYIDSRDNQLKRYYGTDGTSIQEITFESQATEILPPEISKEAPLGVNLFLEHNKKLDTKKRNKLDYIIQFEEDRQEAEESITN